MKEVYLAVRLGLVVKFQELIVSPKSVRHFFIQRVWPEYMATAA
jgi:hypothetical protein